MTSEVVVMNRLGIALASDSASTVRGNDGRVKLFHADKLFMLSKRHPVGVMIYNNSSLLGVPWEAIIKMYRQKNSKRRELDTLEQYADDFIRHLDNNNELFPVKVQESYYLEQVKSFFNGLRVKITRINFQRSNFEGKTDPAADYQEAKYIILETHRKWSEKEDVHCYDPKIGMAIAGQYSGLITELTRSYFAEWGIGAEEQTALWQLATYIISKDEIFPESLSGVVIAGFGANQHFPVMLAYELGEVYSGRIKYKLVKTEKIDSYNTAAVEPFADKGMVDTFLHGISPVLKRKLQKVVTKLMQDLPDNIFDKLSGIGQKRKKAYKQECLSIIDNHVMRPLQEKLDEYKDEHSHPVKQAIAFLPKNELAHVAASLVNLNIFQKRMSTNEDETVGGPIDVAVISKGDGFVWIARKHYFPRELNQHFFLNYGVTATNKKGDENGEASDVIGNDKTE